MTKMVAKGFDTGDLVWAKMKGFRPWPGKIIIPPPGSKIKKAKHYVYFFGSDDHAWILDENIVLHDEESVDKYTKGQKMSSVFLDAVEKIAIASKGISKYQKQKDSENFEKLSAKDGSKTKSPHSNSIAKKGEIKRKVPVKKNLVIKKESKKRSAATERNGSDSGSSEIPFKMIRNDDDYSNLLSNVPPNNTLFDEPIISESNAIEGRHKLTGALARNYVERPATPPIKFEEINESISKEKIEPIKKRIGFLGLGKMGQRIVKNFIQTGHSVILWNRTREKCNEFVENGAKVVGTPYDVVVECDIIFCCVSDPHASNNLVFGNWGVLKALEESPTKNKGYVELSSLDPKTSQAIGDEIVLKAGRYLEAPLCGSRTNADKGSLFILCAGDRSLYDECKSCFHSIGKIDWFMGRSIGTAAKYSIVYSMLLGTMYAAMAESLALVGRVELKQSDFLDILQFGIQNDFVGKGHRMIETNYACDTPLKHQQKDINFGLILGSSVEQPMPITAMANEMYKHCKQLRYGDHDVSAIFEGTR